MSRRARDGSELGACLGAAALLLACQASLDLGGYVFTGGGASGAAGAAGAMSGGAPGSGGTSYGAAGASGAAGSAEGGSAGGDPDGGPSAPPCDTTGLPPLAVPPLAGPARGLYTGSLHAEAAEQTLRPHFGWGAVTSDCPGLTYQLQLDDSCSPGALDSCAFASPELDAAGLEGTTFQPDSDLPVSSSAPVGALYAWRVRACDSGDRCSGWSEIRHLFVGRVPDDLNGDGFADVVVQHSEGPTVFLGGVQFDQIADGTLSYTMASPQVFLGDVNGDGFADLGATIGYAPTTGLAPHVLFGGPDIGALGGVTLTNSAGTASTNTVIRAAGDIDGDGFADLVVHLNNRSTTDIYLGGATLSANPDLPLSTPLTELNATPASGSAGDVNGDGYPDLALVVSPDLDSAQLLLGGPSPSATLSEPIPFGVSCNYTNIVVSAGGDVNGDGFGDFFVSCSGVGAFGFLGASAPGTSWATSRQPDTTVMTVASGFDIDRDGLDDVLLGLSPGDPLLFLGTGSGIDLQTPELDAMGDLAAARQIAVADHNGDALADFVTGGYDVSVQRANGDGSLDPQAVGGFVSGAETSIQGAVVY